MVYLLFNGVMCILCYVPCNKYKILEIQKWTSYSFLCFHLKHNGWIIITLSVHFCDYLTFVQVGKQNTVIARASSNPVFSKLYRKRKNKTKHFLFLCLFVSRSSSSVCVLHTGDRGDTELSCGDKNCLRLTEDDITCLPFVVGHPWRAMTNTECKNVHQINKQLIKYCVYTCVKQ